MRAVSTFSSQTESRQLTANEQRTTYNTSPRLCVYAGTRYEYWPCRSGWRKPGTRSAAPGWCPWRLASRSGSRFHWWCGRWWWVAAPSPRGCAAAETGDTKAEEVWGRLRKRQIEKSLRLIKMYDPPQWPFFSVMIQQLTKCQFISDLICTPVKSKQTGCTWPSK